MKKKIISQSQPPEFVSVMALKTIQWNYNDSTEFVAGNIYTIPAYLYQSLIKYFVISENKPIEEIKDGE